MQCTIHGLCGGKYVVMSWLIITVDFMNKQYGIIVTEIRDTTENWQLTNTKSLTLIEIYW